MGKVANMGYYLVVLFGVYGADAHIEILPEADNCLERGKRGFFDRGYKAVAALKEVRAGKFVAAFFRTCHGVGADKGTLAFGKSGVRVAADGALGAADIGDDGT